MNQFQDLQSFTRDSFPTFFNPFNTKRRDQIREWQKQIEDCQRTLDDEKSNDNECNIAYDALLDLRELIERPEFWALELLTL
jgi:hypothetical protein